MKCNILLLLSGILLIASCSPLEEGQSIPVTQTELAPSLFVEDVYEVEMWVESMVPPQGKKVLVSGGLIKNGVYLGGMAMEARWPDEEKDDRIADCVVQVIYQRGVCLIDTSMYPPGEYVPINILFRHNGGEYTGQTGFTPQ